MKHMKKASLLTFAIIFLLAGNLPARADDVPLNNTFTNTFRGEIALFIMPIMAESMTICVNGDGALSKAECQTTRRIKEVGNKSGSWQTLNYEFKLKAKAIHLLSISVDGRNKGYTLAFPTAPAAQKKTDMQPTLIQTMTLSILDERGVYGEPLISLWPDFDTSLKGLSKPTHVGEEEISFDMKWLPGNCGIPNSQGIPVTVSYHAIPNFNH